MDHLLSFMLLLNHRLRGSPRPVLTATHHSYGSPRLSDFFPSRLSGLWGSDLPTDLHAKWLKRHVFSYTSKNSKNKKMVIKLLQQSTFRRYAANVLSPFFLFLLFSMCNIMSLTGVINYVFAFLYRPLINLLSKDSFWVLTS